MNPSTVPGRIDPSGGVIIADLPRDVIELCQGDPGFEVLWCIGQRAKLLIRGHDQMIRIALFDLSLGVGPLLGKQAGPREVEIGRQHIEQVFIDRSGEAMEWTPPLFCFIIVRQVPEDGRFRVFRLKNITYERPPP